MPTSAFRAFRIHNEGGKIVPRLENLKLGDLNPGELVVKVGYSSINYKDALAGTGAGKILRKFPLVGGIDLAGEVVESHVAATPVGTKVLVTGCGLSETHDGGYAEYACIQNEWAIPIPQGLDEYTVMAIGTAGFTAALAIHRMEQNGQAPQNGPVVVTGATGGVGSLAIDMLTARGYEVVALTGKRESESYLRDLGARRVLLRDAVNWGSRPLEEAQWAGAIDNVGGEVLTWLTRTANFWANIASIGLAASADLKTTVLPFILRGVNLLGINSVFTPRAIREQVWKRLASDLKPRRLDRIVTRTVELEQLSEAFTAYTSGTVVGRAVVRTAKH